MIPQRTQRRPKGGFLGQQEIVGTCDPRQVLLPAIVGLRVNVPRGHAEAPGIERMARGAGGTWLQQLGRRVAFQPRNFSCTRRSEAICA